MERLTDWINEEKTEVSIRHDRFRDAMIRLADYEDTGLEPEGILALKRHERWIPVQERLPKAKEDVLVCTKSGWILIAWYGPNGQRWHITPADAGSTREDIVAWLPLPEPFNPQN